MDKSGNMNVFDHMPDMIAAEELVYFLKTESDKLQVSLSGKIKNCMATGQKFQPLCKNFIKKGE